MEAQRQLLAGAEQLRIFVSSSSGPKLRAVLPALRRRRDNPALDPAAMAALATISAYVTRLVVGRRAANQVAQERTLLVTGYVGSVMERLRLERIVASEEVMSLLPPEMLKYSGAPMVVYKYFESVGQLVCNWGAAARAATRNARTCNCADPRLVPFHGAGVCHVVTKDVRVVENAALRTLLSRGVKFRDTFTELFSSDSGSGGSQRQQLQADILAMVDAGCWKLAKQQSDLNGIEEGRFLPWVSTVNARAKAALGALTDAEVQEISAAVDARQRWDTELTEAVTALRKRFVISVADKETAVAVITCRPFWEQRVRQEVDTSGVYTWYGSGAQEARAGRPAAASPCAPPLAPVAPGCAAPPPPPLAPPPIGAPMLEVDEATRILRATHEFGVLGDLLCSVLPNATRIERMYEEAQMRLQGAAATAVRFGRPAPSAELILQAEKRLTAAFYMLRRDASRRVRHQQLLACPPPVTARKRCPIDVDALMLYAAAWCVDGVALGLTIVRPSDRHAQHLNGRSVADVILSYVQRFVTLLPSGGGIGYVDLEYHHGARTAALVAAGWLTGGREWATGDAFKELTSELRAVALRRFGFDFDDSAAYPRAALHAIPTFRHLPGMLLRGDNRKSVMAQLGAMLLPSWSHPATCIDSARCRACKEIKRLINLLDMDGTYGGWRATVGQQQAGMLGPGWPDLGPMQSNGPALTLPSGDIFHVRQYLREQPLRTQWV